MLPLPKNDFASPSESYFTQSQVFFSYMLCMALSSKLLYQEPWKMNNDRCLTGLPSVCAQHQCIMCKSSKSAPQAPSSLKTEWKKNVLGLLLRCLYLVLSLGQGSPFPPFSKYQGIFSNKLSPNMFAAFTVPTCLPCSLSCLGFHNHNS